jgi:hypothetical protein
MLPRLAKRLYLCVQTMYPSDFRAPANGVFAGAILLSAPHFTTNIWFIRICTDSEINAAVKPGRLTDDRCIDI